MIKKDGKVISPNQQTIGSDGTQYPAGFFSVATCAATGAIITNDPVYPNSNFYTWEFTTSGSILVKEKPIEDCRNYLSAKVKEIRDLKFYEGFSVAIGNETKWFKSDLFSKSQLVSRERIASGLLSQGKTEDFVMTDELGPIEWKTMDGSYVPLTIGLAIAALAASVNMEYRIFNASKAHLARIEVLTDAKSAESYDVTADWPLTYKD